MISPGIIEYRGMPKPEQLGEKDVLLKIERIGVCGSDVHVFHGEHPATHYPVVQGHEYSATVHEVGDGISSIEPGMKATAWPQLVCWKCGPCLRGQYNACQELKVQGFQAPGVVVSYTDDPDIQNGKKFIEQGLQIAAGVPLMCDEPEGFRTFRLGLFGLDKLGNIDRTVAHLADALDRITG